MTTLLTAAHLLSDNGLIPNPILVFEDGILATIATRTEQPLPPANTHHDYPNATLAPAFLDVHTHGCRGRDVMEATPEALAAIHHFLARHGVGAYLPTTITAGKDATFHALAGLAKLLAPKQESNQAPAQPRPLGIHLEGPFLSHTKRGAHPPHNLLEPSIPFFDAMWQAAEGRITLMTIAPELPGALPLIAHAVALGVHVSIGHSDGLAADAQAAIAAGATSATHTFNAMRGLSHREPGILGAVLTTDSLYAELICDGMHVDPSIVQLFARAKPADRAILVTDAMSAAGMPDGNYKLGELDVRVTGGRAITSNDTLAGSTLTLDAAVRNYIRFANVPLENALYAATRNPAQMTHLRHTTGSLVQGRRADLNVLSPDGHIQATYLAGALVSPQI